MSNRWIPILATLAAMLIGHILTRISIADCNERAEKTAKFRDKFIDLANHYMQYHQVNAELYQDCIREVDDIQEELGYDGIIAEIVDPLKRVKMSNVQILVNAFPEMTSMVSQMDTYIIQVRMSQYFQQCTDSMEKHIGRIGRIRDTELKRMWNPVFCFGRGIRRILSLPLDILFWLGILDAKTNRAFKGNTISRLLGKVATFIGFVSSVMSIILGWNEFARIISEILQKICAVLPI